MMKAASAAFFLPCVRIIHTFTANLPMMKQINDFTLVDKVAYGRSVWQRYRCETSLPTVEAGQFLQVRVDDSPSTYLRRPLSIHDVDASNNTIDLLVQTVGEGTRHLASLPVGAVVNMILPLGNGFTIPECADEKTLLVGGGIGMAPLLLLGKTLIRKGLRPTFLFGGKNVKDLVRLAEYEKFGEVMTTTEDGSFGQTGLVTQHEVWDKRHFDKVYVCGPKPMMKVVAALAKEKHVWCEVSLENMMACGLGACLCCVENTVDGNLCVCKEGPVFNTRRLLW